MFETGRAPERTNYYSNSGLAARPPPPGRKGDFQKIGNQVCLAPSLPSLRCNTAGLYTSCSLGPEQASISDALNKLKTDRHGLYIT